MNIVFASVALSDSGTATGILIGNMIDELHKMGHTVTCVGIKRSLYDPDITEYRGSKIYHSDYVISFRSKKKHGKDFLLALKKRIWGHTKKNRKMLYDNWLVCSMIEKLEEIQADQYDVLVAVCANHDALKAIQLFKQETKCTAKVILIQYDPLAENFGLQYKGKNNLVKYEKELFGKCDAILSTPFILKSKEFIPDNIIIAELPAVVNKGERFQLRQSKNILSVYAGDFYRGIREPYVLLRLFQSFTDERIQLHIIGGGFEEELRKMSEESMKGRLFIHGRLSEAECNQWIEKADILVNLGNKINNQLPSKVLNYACYGKTILNLFSIPDCPTLQYLEEYPLVINVDCCGEISAKKMKQVEKEILAKWEKRLKFDDIQKIYYKCTPQYVVKQLIEASK